MPDCRFLVVLAPFLIAASSPQTANLAAKEREARKACLVGDYVRGVDILADLYIDTSDTTYLFNQGRCFEQNHRYEDAISRFREYLQKTPADWEEERADVVKHIAACKAVIETEHAAADRSGSSVAASAEPVAAAAASPKPAPIQTARPPQAASVSPKTQTPVKTPGFALRTSGLVIAAVGVVALGCGVGFNLRANSLADEIRAGDPSKRSAHDTSVALGWAGYGLGAAALATGATLYLLGWREGRTNANLALVPSLLPDEASLVLRGAF